MPTLVIKSVPPKLHAKLKRTASLHRRSVTQETMYLLEKALEAEEHEKPASVRSGQSYWGTRAYTPAYTKALKAGAFGATGDSSGGVSRERDER
jgi:plasmid stability protein